MDSDPLAPTKADASSAVARRRFPRIELRDLELFAAVAEAGSITHGARRAHLSLPAASARLRAMEDAIGTATLTRGRRGVTLTAAGRLLREHAIVVLARIDRMTGELASFADGLVANVRVLANSSAVDTFLPTHLTAFLRGRPQVDVDLRERPSPDIVHALAAGHADLGIVTSSVDTAALRCAPLLDDRLVVAVGPGHALADRPAVRFEACLGHPLVGLSEGRALADHLDGHARPLGDRAAHRIRLPTLAAVCDGVEAGLGVAVIPDRVARPHVARGAIATVALDEDWADRRLLLCHVPDASLSSAAEDLLAHLGAAST